MKKVFFIISLLFIISITSCSTFKVNIEGQQETVKEFKSFAILNVYICPPNVPTFPLIDAAIYKGSYNDIYADVTMFHDKQADTVVTYLGQQFEKYTKSKILYGENLYSMFKEENIKKYDLKTYPLILNNDNFPKVILPKYAVNFFDFSNESTPGIFFNKTNLKSLQPQLKNICELLNVDGLLIVTVTVATASIGMFGMYGERVLSGELIFLDKEGNRICEGDICSEQSEGKPNDLQEYQFVFNEYYRLSDLFLRKLYLGEDPKK